MTPWRALLVLILAGLACAQREPLVTSGRVDPALVRAVRAAGVSIAPVVRVNALAAPPLAASSGMGRIEAGLHENEEHLPTPTVLDVDDPTHAAFVRNELLGHVRFGGGFVRTGDVALEVRARLIEIGAGDGAFADEAAAWLRDAVPRVLDAKKVPIGAPAPAVAPIPERRRFRGLHPEDGRDNVNLPRTDLVPTPLDVASLSTTGARFVLVPYLRSYYSHNGGWFLGQTFGCTAGARVEALIVLYDAVSGRPAWSMPLVGRHIQPQKGQATTAELDQYLLWAEASAEEQLARGWLK